MMAKRRDDKKVEEHKAEIDDNDASFRHHHEEVDHAVPVEADEESSYQTTTCPGAYRVPGLDYTSGNDDGIATTGADTLQLVEDDTPGGPNNTANEIASTSSTAPMLLEAMLVQEEGIPKDVPSVKATKVSLWSHWRLIVTFVLVMIVIGRWFLVWCI